MPRIESPALVTPVRPLHPQSREATTWVLVADAARARFFRFSPDRPDWTEVACLNNPDGRTTGRDTTTDRPPRTLESANAARHAIEPHTSPRDKRQHRFAREIVQLLEQEHGARAFERLVVVAPPRFLGVLGGLFGADLQACVTGQVRHDFTGLRADEIRTRLAAELR